MIETHICNDCAPVVALEVARQELGLSSVPILLCLTCTANLENLFEPPLILPWALDDLDDEEFPPFPSRKFDIVQELNIAGKDTKYFVKADLFPLV